MAVLDRIEQSLRVLPRLALNSLLPPRCLSCGETVERPGALCAACWEGVDFLAPPYCDLCGFPFEFDLGPGALCGRCAGKPPAFDRARAVMRYDAISRRLILGFKYADRTEGTRAYGSWLARAGAELLADAALIAPVPLHWSRLFSRRYNQAALLAHALGGQTRIPVVADLLRRGRWTRSQGRLSVAARRRNVAGAFRVSPARAPLLSGRRVLLIDDVLTSGATASACSKALRRAGAAAVDVLVLARVI